MSFNPFIAQSTEAPWPAFQHNLKHTGRSPYVGPEIPILKWKYYVGKPIFPSPSIGADGTVYIGSDKGRLYAIYPNGKRKWYFQAESYVRSFPALNSSDGTIYAGTYLGYLYAVNPDGSLKWSFKTPD